MLDSCVGNIGCMSDAEVNSKPNLTHKSRILVEINRQQMVRKVLAKAEEQTFPPTDAAWRESALKRRGHGRESARGTVQARSGGRIK